MKQVFSLIFLFAFSILLSYSCSGPPETTAVMSIPATQLYSDYKANQVAADQKYKDKTVLVQGSVKEIGKDILGTPYIMLAGWDQYAIGGVQCLFSDKGEISKLANIRKGDTVSIKGRVDGYLIMSVFLKDSYLQTK